MKPQDKKCASFTLIELLVVIAIIGLLASIVLVSFSGVRERARIAKMLDFSQSIQNVLGSEAVGVWIFDDCTAKDSSGYGNDGTINGASCVDETPQGAIGQGTGKYALSFDGNDDVNAGNEESLNMGINNFSVEFWFKANQEVPKTHQLVNRYDGSRGYAIYYDLSNRLSVFMWGSGGSGSYLQTVVSSNEWHHVVYVRTPSLSKGTFYIDGKKREQGENFGDISNAGNQLIGRITYGEYFKGIIDEVRIYNSALPSAEIQKHYAQGLEKHKISAIIK